jgi:hypothetical protein
VFPLLVSLSLVVLGAALLRYNAFAPAQRLYPPRAIGALVALLLLCALVNWGARAGRRLRAH